MVANRARMMANLCKPSASGMLAVNAPPEKIEELLKSRPDLSNLTIACRNSTADCVVAGDLQQVDILRAHLKDNSIAKCIKLDVPYGYHSSAMDPILEPLTALAGSVKFSAPRIITGSNVLGKIIGSSDINAEYFAKHARHTVHFAEEIQEITSLPEFSGNVRYIEIGPHPISLPMVRSTLGSTASNAEFIPSMHKTKDPWVSLSDSLAGLFLSGFPAKWREVYAGSLAICVDIPSYPFEDKEFWVDYKEHNKATEVKDIAPEPSTGMATGYAMLASCVQLPGDGVDGIFETPISQLASSIMGHQVGGAALCPASIYHELAMSSAAFGVHSTTAALHTLSKIKYSHPLVYEDGSKKIVRVTLKLDSLTGDSSFTVSSYTDNPNSSQLHCAGELKQIPKASIEHKFNHRGLKLERTKISIFTSNGRQGPETIHTRMLYETIFPRVVSYSKPYQTIKSMTIDQTGTEGYAIVQIPTGYKSGKHVVNPVFMDTLLHAAGFIANSSVTAEEACICNETGQARILYDEIDYDDTFGVFCSVVYLAKESTFIADAYAANSAGKIVGGLKGMQFKKVNLAKFRKHLAHTLGKKAPTPQAAKTISTPVIQHVAPQAAPQAVAVAPAVDVVGQVARVIAEVCGVSLDNVTSGTEMEALGVDSLMIFEIADKLKATFSQITIDSSELAACHTVKDLEDAISKHMPAQSAAPPPSAPPPAPAPKAAPALIDTPPPSPPSGPALLDIKGFLESILGVSASDMQPDTDLESLGLDSLTSIEVLHSLKQSIGIDISPDTMNECKTIYDFESLVTKSMPRPSAPAPKDVSPAKDDTTELKKMLQMTSNPVSLQTRAGSGAPLFLVHDGSGMCNYYQRLSPLERNTWGFYNPRFFEMEQWSGGLADMASAYAKDIQETSPGPYILGGKLPLTHPLSLSDI
jgi:iterative type I PKS product template protein